ncbi:hypothetical protein [Streptomyces mirabilis]|uniref:hypothetical protein n=1 Tax=Streptomyces mirabilis TaxID=68239 RepID=UPI00399D75C8
MPGSQWVTLRLDVATDVHLLMTLVSLALQAHQARPVLGDVLGAECNDHRIAVLLRGNPR